MAGGADKVEGAHLKGLSRIFNAETNFGRANVAKATYAVLGGLFLYLAMKPKKK